MRHRLAKCRRVSTVFIVNMSALTAVCYNARVLAVSMGRPLRGERGRGVRAGVGWYGRDGAAGVRVSVDVGVRDKPWQALERRHHFLRCTDV